jgi:hypothetical protein
MGALLLTARGSDRTVEASDRQLFSGTESHPSSEEKRGELKTRLDDGAFSFASDVVAVVAVVVGCRVVGPADTHHA